MQTIYIDISNKSILPTIYAKQGDVGRKFKAVVLENSVSREITVNEHFSAGYDGASGSGNYETIGERSAFEVYGNVVTVELAPNMLQAPGLSNFCLTMNSGDGNVIGLWNVIVDVEETPGFLGDPIKDYYPGISAVLYVDQNLSKEQKEKARANIGSGTGNVKTVNGIAPDENGNVVVAGGSGIHIGTEAPTDESVSVWIDTDEEAPESSGGVSSWNEIANTEVTSAHNETTGAFGFTVYWLTQLRPDKATMAIVYDGVRYDNQQPTTVEGIGELFGNLYYLNAMYGTSFENTGEPFIGFYNGSSLYFMTLDTEATKHTISVMVYGMPYINYPVIDLKSYIDDISLEGDWVVLNDLPVLKEWHKILMQNDAVWIDAVVDGLETSFVVHPVRGFFTSVHAFTPVINSGGNILFVCIDLKEDQITVYARPA